MLRAAGLIALVAWGRLGAVASADDGTTWAAYGSRPIVHCRPLYLTDVTLERGERITTVAIGDSARWRLGRGVAGAGGETVHVFVKPAEFATSTNLEILTDRRVYSIELVNDGKAYAPRLAFYDARPRRQAVVVRDSPSEIASPRKPTTRRVSAAQIRHAPFPRGYFTTGAINVSHTATRTYVSIDGSLRGRRITFTSDEAGRQFLTIVRHASNIYVLYRVVPRLYIWENDAKVASAIRLF
jgi:hypothetical protein